MDSKILISFATCPRLSSTFGMIFTANFLLLSSRYAEYTNPFDPSPNLPPIR